MPPRAEIVVDLAAVRHNVRRLREVVGPDVAMMTIVKADGYGHGMVPVARAAREAGASWLGVATVDEALALRAGGDTGRVLCWLTVPGDDHAAAAAADVDVTAYSVAALDEMAAAGGGPRPAQGRHRPVPRGRRAGRLGRPVRARPAPGAGGPAAGHGHLVAPGRQRRAGPPRQRRPGGRVRRRAGAGGDRRAGPGGPSPRQLRRRGAATAGPRSTWCGAASRRTASTPRPASPPTSVCGRR